MYDLLIDTEWEHNRNRKGKRTSESLLPQTWKGANISSSGLVGLRKKKDSVLNEDDYQSHNKGVLEAETIALQKINSFLKDKASLLTESDDHNSSRQPKNDD